MNTTISTPRRRRRSTTIVATLAALAAVGSLLLTQLPSTPDRPRPGSLLGSLPSAKTSSEPRADLDAHDAVPEQRTALPQSPQRSPSFAEYVDQLVSIGMTTMRLLQDGQHDAARQSDERAQALFAEMNERIARPETEALPLLSAAPLPAGDDQELLLRRRILCLTMGAALTRMLPAGERADPPMAADATVRAPLDEFVAAMLTTLPANALLAEELGQGMLADQPYLGLAHERPVLDLVAMSGEGAFPAPVAAALLTTLWRNLQARNLRSSAELAGLALLMLANGNATERLGAARLLLADDRYRAVVLDHLRRSKSEQLASELSMAAAQELPVDLALPFLVEASKLTHDFFAPFLMLGSRDVDLLQRTYEQKLADDADPKLRDLLVAGAGFTKTPAGLAVARTAFDHDPDPDVRIRALFALTANAASALGEQAINQALDDPAIGNNPDRITAVVVSLENLVRAGLVNAVHRIGLRLSTHAALPDYARRQLADLLAGSLPRGLPDDFHR